MNTKTITLPQRFVKVLEEQDSSRFTQEQRDEVCEFCKLNGLGILLSLHYQHDGKVIGKFSTAIDVPSQIPDLEKYHIIEDDVDGNKIHMEVPLKVTEIPDCVIDYIIERIDRNWHKGDTSFADHKNDEVNLKWWIVEDEPEIVAPIAVYILQGEELVGEWERNGVHTREEIYHNDGWAMFHHSLQNPREVEIIDKVLKDVLNEDGYKILCDLPGYIPMSAYTGYWFDNLGTDAWVKLFGERCLGQIRFLWDKLGEVLQYELYNLVESGNTEHFPKIELACEVATIQLCLEYELEERDMCVDDGRESRWNPFFQERFNELYEEILERMVKFHKTRD